MHNYSGNGVDDDKETLLSFSADELLGDVTGPGTEEDWVATHTGATGE